MIKNESVVNNIDNKKLEEFSVDGYHRKCFDEGDHDYIDQSFLKLLEYNTDEFEQNLSNHFLDLIYEKDRIVYSDLMSKLKTGEFSGKIQYRIKTKSGKYLVVEENFKSLISCSGKIWCLGIVKRINYNNSEDLFKAKCEMIKDEDAPYGIMRCSFEEYPRIEYMNSCMMRFIGASIFNEYKLYAENIFFMISHLYRDKFREILSGLSTFSDPVFISHNIVKINGSNLFLNGWGWVEYNENKEKQFCFFYGLPASAYNEDKNEGDFISSLKPSYNLIIKLDIEKGTAECVHKSVERPLGVSYDVVLTIESARNYFVNNYIEKDDRATVEKFIDDIINFAPVSDKKHFHTDFSVVLDDGSQRRYHAISMKLNDNLSYICARDITDIKYSSDLEYKCNMLHKLWRNLNRFNLRNKTEAITFEEKGDFIFPIYCSDNLCKRMSVSESDFYKIAIQGISKELFFEKFGIDDQVYKKMLNHEQVEFLVPDGTGGRKSFLAKLVAEGNNIYTAMMFLEHEPKELVSNLLSQDIKTDENTKENDMFVPGNKSKIWIRTFGAFDVFLDGVPIRFPSAKAKELLAILVDRRGGSLTAEQAISYLWEDRVADKQAMSNYRKVAMKLQNTLNKYNIGDIIINNRGVRSLNMGIVDCDYFRYLKKDQSIIDVFHGQYMQDYSWGETTLAAMLNSDNFTIE